MHFRLHAAAIAAVFVLAGCHREPQARRYTEIAFHEKAMGMPMAQAPIHITWANLPPGWVEQSGGDPMRAASFRAQDSNLTNTGEIDPKAVDVSIVQLAGDAGGIPANIKRWLGQIKVTSTPAQIQTLIDKAPSISTATGQKGMFLDFTGVLSGDITQSTSILGAIFQNERYTVFVKAMGERERLVKLKGQMFSFCRNLSIAEDAK